MKKGILKKVLHTASLPFLFLFTQEWSDQVKKKFNFPRFAFKC